MATQQELYQLLDAADKAGNQQDVEEVLAAIQQFQAAPTPESQMQLPPEPPMAPSHGQDMSVKDIWDLATQTSMPRPEVTPEKVSTTLSGLVPFGSELYSGAKAAFGSGEGDGYWDRYQSNIEEEKANIGRFFKEDPVKASVAMGVPALLTGSLATKFMAPKTALGGIGYATGEGAAWGAGAADPGLQNRMKGAGIGGGVGAGTGVGLSLAQRLLGAGGPTLRGVKEMMFGKPAEKTKDIADTSRLHIAGMFEDEAPEEILKNFDTLSRTSKTPVVADALDEPYEAWVSEVVSSGGPQQIQAKKIINEVLDPRAKTKTLPVEDALQANEKTIQRNVEYKNNVEAIRKKIGDEKDSYLAATAGEPVPVEDDVYEFLNRSPENKKLLNQAVNRLESRGLKVTYRDQVDDVADGLLGEAEDVNKIVIDRPLFEEMKDILNDDISVAKFSGSKDAHKAEVLTQFKKLMKGEDAVLDDLSSKYHKVKNRQRAYAAGLDDFQKLRYSDLQETLQSMSKQDYQAFRRGVLTDIGNDRGGLFKLLESDNGQRKLTALLGEDTPEKALQALDTAKKQAGTQEAMKAGRKKFAGGERADWTMKGQLQRLTNLFARLQGKRAYSAQGGVFMFGNEVFEILQRTDLSDEVLTQIVKDLGRTGGDARQFVQQLAKYDVPRVKEAVKEAADRTALRAKQMGGYGAAGGALQDQLLQPSHTPTGTTSVQSSMSNR